MIFDFKDQTAIVTGGTRGIGRAVCEALLLAGARVVATYLDDDKAALEFLAANRSADGRLTIKKFDVADYGEVDAFFRDQVEESGPFQVLVHSSGIRRDAVVGMMKAEDWNRVIQTNLTGTFNVLKQAVQAMMQARYGRIVVITSPIGHFGFAGQSNYAASKAGQVALVRSLSKEVATRGITVNCVSPGFIDTDFIADLPEKQKAAYLGMVPMKRFGSPAEVARPVLFLASRESAYITGSVNEITGGL